jgi:hypothetical protein
MKKKKGSKSAFFYLRTLLVVALLLAAGIFTLFAFGDTPVARSVGLRLSQGSQLLSRCMSTIALHLPTHTQRGSGASAASSKFPGDKLPQSPGSLAAVDSKAPNELHAIKPVKTIPLREMAIIPPNMAPGHEHAEPMSPPPPTKGAGVDTARQTILGSELSAPTSTGVSWDGVGVGLAGFVPASNPPDVNGRVGATQYVQWNNTSFAVFNKNTGALLFGPAAGNTLFQSLGGVCASHNDGDPVVSYDILSGRWLLSQFVVNGGVGSASHQCMAVSQTSDATGAYYLYDFVTDAANFVDYPHTGVWPDGYYMSAHIFNAAGTAVVAARVYVFERDKMIAGQAARMQSANLTTYGGSFQFGFLPADLDSLTPPPAGEAAFVLGPHPTTLTLTASTRVAVTWGLVPTITLTEATITNTTYSTAFCVSTGRLCVPQSGQASSAALDNIKGHFMYRLAYRNNGTQASPQESLVVNIPVRGATTNTTHDAIRWYEFRNAGNSTATPTIFQQSTFDPDTNYRWLGSIAMDKDGDMAMGYSRSSATTFPSVYINGRLSTDTINTIGTEALVQAGAGSQDATGVNRWGDYSSMTLDPVDQCTFYYTNEYLKTTGAFNWSTRVASYRFPTCTNAPAWGTVSGTVTSCATGAPISGVVVTLNNGFASATDASGNYSILVPAGNYTATAADANRNCATSTPASMALSVVIGGNTTQNFCMTGASNLQNNGVTVDDSGGNGNGVINANECVNLKLGVKNNGCATESAIAATLTTSTSGVTITQPNATYPNMVIDASGNNSVPFIIQTSNSFACGTNIALSLNLTYAGGSKTIAYTIPTCTGGATQAIPASAIVLADSTQPDRLGRTGAASTCSGKACPGAINSAGTRNYKTFNFTNSASGPACITVNMHAVCGGAGDISSAAYLNAYVPPVAQGDAAGNMCLNYLGDTGIVGLGTTVPNASYNFSVPASSNFVVVVNTNTGSTTCSEFDATLSGFYDFTAGPGACAAAPVLQSAASRMTHGGGAGTFDRPMPLSGPSGIEPRSAGTGNFTAVMTFNGPVNGGTASVTGGTGSVSSVTFSGNSMIIGLTGVTDQQVVTVTASNVSGPGTTALPSASMQIGFLIGDVTGDAAVNVGDTIPTRSHAGQTLDNTNFQYDVTVDGFINVGDTIVVRSKSGDFIP